MNLISQEHQLVNNKLVFKMPQNNIFHLPHNGKPMKDEMVVRVLLGYPEPSDKLSREDKIKKHVEQNNSFVDKMKSQFNNLLFTDISKISNEVWLGFPTESMEIINELTTIDDVAVVYVYNIPSDHPLFVNFSVDNAIEQFKNKTEIKSTNIKAIGPQKIDKLTVKTHKYDEFSKTLTLDLGFFSTEHEVEQLFAYMYQKGTNWEKLLEKLALIIFQVINVNYEHKPIARVNFDINSETRNENSPNRSIQVTPRPLVDLKSKSEQERYLHSSFIFAKDNTLNQIKTSIQYALKFHEHLLKAILRNVDVLNEIKDIPPSSVNVEDMKKVTGDVNKLVVKLSVFDTQDRVNLLFSYLAQEPNNKELWLGHLQNIILDSLKTGQLGEISNYNLISFDWEHPDKNDVYQASIGGLANLYQNFELENRHSVVQQPFPDFTISFDEDHDISTGILINLDANADTYLNYNTKSEILFEYPKNLEKRSLKKLDEETEKALKHYEGILSSLSISYSSFNSKTNRLDMTIKGLEDKDSLIKLFALINLDLHKNGSKWIEKLSDVIKQGISKAGQNVHNIRYINLLKDNNEVSLTLPSIGGYSQKAPVFGSQKPEEIVTELKTLTNNDSISKGLYYYIESNSSSLLEVALANGFVGADLTRKPFARQFLAVNLNGYFNKFNNDQIEFAYKDVPMGILEAQNGLIDYHNKDVYQSNKVIVNTGSGEIENHADLVGRIACSTLEGVDSTSTIISSGFYSSNDKDDHWNAHNALDWIVAQGAKIINCSWGVPKDHPTDPDFMTYTDLAYKMDYIVRKYGIVIVKAAGNSHRDFKPFFRAANLSLNIIVVGSTNKTGNRLSIFSDYEKYSRYNLTNDAPKPLLVAPGEAYFYKGKFVMGTSFATPLVSGTISILMKEFDKLDENPVGIMTVLAASSDDKFQGKRNTNGLKVETGAGLLDYKMARIATTNLITKEIKNSLQYQEIVFENREFTLEKNQEVSISVSSLFNGGYVNLIEGPDLYPVEGGITTVPLIGNLYLLFAYTANMMAQNHFESIFDKYREKLNLHKSINPDDLDNYLSPPILTVILEEKDDISGRWSKVNMPLRTTSNYSNINKFVYKNTGLTRRYRYTVKIANQARHLPNDYTHNKVATTYVIRNKPF